MTVPVLWYTLCWAHSYGEVLAGDGVVDAVSARFEVAEACLQVRARWREVRVRGVLVRWGP